MHAPKVLELYDRWKADKIVAEVNFGGSMVESTIRTVRRHAPIRLLNASRGKVQRAEPVAALYSQEDAYTSCFRHTLSRSPENVRKLGDLSNRAVVAARPPMHGV